MEKEQDRIQVHGWNLPLTKEEERLLSVIVGDVKELVRDAAALGAQVVVLVFVMESAGVGHELSFTTALLMIGLPESGWLRRTRTRLKGRFSSQAKAHRPSRKPQRKRS